VKAPLDISPSSISSSSFFILTNRISSVRIRSAKAKKDWIYGLFPIMIGLGASVEYKAIGFGLIAFGVLVTIAIALARGEHEVIVSMPGLDFTIYKTNDFQSAADIHQKIVDALKAA